jgi:hypothetical protein
MKLLREPLVHFLLLGAVLFGVFALVGDRGSERASHIVVTPGHLEHLMVSFTRTWQCPSTDSVSRWFLLEADDSQTTRGSPRADASGRSTSCKEQRLL